MSLNPLNRKPEANINHGYFVRIQLGLVVSMLLFVLIFKVNFSFEPSMDFEVVEREIVELEEIIQTEIIEAPPPPPRPPAPISVPDDIIMDDNLVDFDAFLDFDDAMASQPAPPPPPSDDEDEGEVFVIVEQMPELIGGMAELQRQIVYPEIARRAGIQGRVVVQFIIDEQGYVNDPFVVRSAGGGLDEAAIAAVQKVRFTPGMQRGRPVRVQYTLPVQFRLTQAD
ncbi:outer membrane transport energization protein TonB [Cyclonatronum proteinivorum]|uniref:Outer membrane transport energization protein TonB n=1 Tax=Cyclonatronum proteinivorum TaxID=1457365 RepID=A0A345ULZ3_9BACT|nr:energy transducer TonB [Cyclonatronum proteinivorum]AXJ01495.1 outer membrane transport energization protein TonB [Cyclonatronum proteinivorum]